MFISQLNDAKLVSKQVDKHALMKNNTSKEVFEFINDHVDLSNESDTAIIQTATPLNLNTIHSDSNILGSEVQAIVNIRRVNHAKYINKLFEATNEKLNYGGIFVGCAETTIARKERILKKTFFPINYILYFLDFIFKRVFPKVFFLKKIYFFITKGRSRVLSEMEVYGRLYSCGFRIVETKSIKNLLYFAAEKIKEPVFNNEATYGPLIKLRRIGKEGKLIKVYKLRTMFPYSEYLQEMVFAQNNLAEGGKIKNDPRVSALGRFFRKFWIDELPMIFNMLKGDLKIVGVRPLSQHYYSLYPESLQQLRIKTKPGLVPPFYADMPKTLEEIIASEERYLNAYLKNPLITDVKYFYLAMYNIFIKKARSK